MTRPSTEAPHIESGAESGTESGVARLLVEAEARGQRLDSYLAARLERESGRREYSRNRLQQLLKAGGVSCAKSGRKLGAAYRLDGGEVLLVAHIRPNEPAKRDAEQADSVAVGALLAKRILYEDSSLLVIDKPAGLVVHPAAGNFSGTLIQGLVALGKVAHSGVRGGLVHRLDKGTSGVMVVARTESAETLLAEQFAQHSIERRYVALVAGVPQLKAGRIEGVLGRNPQNRQKMALLADAMGEGEAKAEARQKRGKRSDTQYRVRATFSATGDTKGKAGCKAGAKQVSLLELRPGTGRTHQIRVHCTALGHPVLGDPTYGGGTRHLSALISSLVSSSATETPLESLGRRPFLHAWRLDFTHPESNERLSFTAPLPEDFCMLLQALGAEKSDLFFLSERAGEKAGAGVPAVKQT